MPTATTITLPYNYTPRDYQLPLFQAMDSGTTRACVIWHRRAGKDKSLLNLVAKKMFERVGSYYYFFPTYNQGRKILWEGMDRDGFKFLDHLPESLRKSTNNQEMRIELKNGSILRVIGTDNIDSIVGTNPIGAVFSEYALQDPQAWDFIRPIMAENGGWAVFNFTPRGKNHGFALWQMAEASDAWFTQRLTVDDTGAINKAVLDTERAEMYAKDGNDAHYMQEYYVSFEAPVQGSYYGTQMLRAEQEGRITGVPYDTRIPVDTFWDLGVGDSTAIWFTQNVGKEIRVIDYYETSGEGLPHYVAKLKEKNYVYGRHTAPHDIMVREWTGDGKARIEVAKLLGIRFDIAPKVSLEDGIEAARNIIGRCWFDKGRCERGISALTSYQKEFDDANDTYKNKPLHNWASHGADAFRYFALGHRDAPQYQPPRQRRFDPITGRPMD